MEKKMSEQAKEFEEMTPKFIFIMIVYLKVWFKQIFESSEYRKTFQENDLSEALAWEVTRFFVSDQLKLDESKQTKKTQEQLKQARRHAAKWADDVMKKDKDFKELVINRLVLEFSILWHLSKSIKVQNKKLEKRLTELLEILSKYKKDVIPQEYTPDFNKFNEIFEKFLSWREVARDRLSALGKGDWIELDIS